MSNNWLTLLLLPNMAFIFAPPRGLVILLAIGYLSYSYASQKENVPRKNSSSSGSSSSKGFNTTTWPSIVKGNTARSRPTSGIIVQFY
jgi:hypothetical protein